MDYSINKNSSPLILAFYLPQYHPFPENDEWWGTGFTEWTNVGKARPLYRGHYQPKVPADLGYYDLRLPIVREQQAELAREAGVSGFCYWHYWFGNGKQLLNEIIDDVIKSKKPDFPFCFGWTNHSWEAKNWSRDGKGNVMLMEQIYGGELDYRKHFEYALKAFKDSRYIKIDNCPLFLIYNPVDLPSDFTSYWQKWAKEEGFDGIYFIARLLNDGSDLCERKTELEQKGLHVFTRERMYSGYKHNGYFKRGFIRFRSLLKGVKIVAPYKDCYPYFSNKEEDAREYFIPGLVPNWDHSPRSKKEAMVLEDAKPEYFYKHAKAVLEIVKQKSNKIILLKSWNEWGEGNYMEPDLKYGKGYIEALRKALTECQEGL